MRRLAQRLAALGGRRLDDATPARRRPAARTAPASTPCSRRWPGPAPLLSLRVPRAAGVHARRAGGRRHGDAGRRPPAARRSWPTAGVPGQRRHRAPARPRCSPPCSRWSTPASGWCWSRTPRELRPDHPHVVGLEARPPNIEGAGAIGLRTLVRQALRMRPDRLVVGEVRGGEVVDLLAALNTGHEGGCGTLHANSAARRAGPGRGARAGRRPRPGGRAQPARLPRSTSCSTSAGTRTARRRLREVAVPGARALRTGHDGGGARAAPRRRHRARSGGGPARRAARG